MGESESSTILKWKAVPCYGAQPHGSRSPVHEAAGVHVPQLCALASTPSGEWLAHLRQPRFVVASCDLTTVPGSESFITLHLLFCQSSELVRFIDDKENLESSGKSPIKMTKLFLVCSFTD